MQLINMQWKKTYKGMHRFLMLYAFGFLFPYLIALFSANKTLSRAMMIICLLVQVVFFSIEIIQMYIMRGDYFQSVWNIFDFG
jgi:hypothetical protein